MGETEAHAKVTILFLAANPQQTPPLALGVEAKRIDARLYASKLGDLFDLRDLWEVEAAELPQALDRFEPALVHVSAHGGPLGQLVFSGQKGRGLPVDAEEFAALFRARKVRCVLLNACDSEPLARLIAKHVNFVVGMSRPIMDADAIAFAAGFYAALGHGESFAEAFRRGKDQIALERGQGTSPGRGSITGCDPAAESDSPPVPVYRQDVDPEKLGLFDSNDSELRVLPPAALKNLPDKPFRYLSPYQETDAPLFFGRKKALLPLLDYIADATLPVLFFHGATGVGKSSLLNAGLTPWLCAHAYAVASTPRGPEGLLPSLLVRLGATGGASLRQAVREFEERAGHPVVVIVDQAEEAYTKGGSAGREEVSALLSALADCIAPEQTNPQSRFIVSFRKEWLAELEREARDAGLPFANLFLEPMGREALVETLEGLRRSRTVRQRYGLVIDQDLVEQLVADLLADSESAITPTLQVVLTRLWEMAEERGEQAPHFKLGDYLALKKKGALLGDFLDQQMERVATEHANAVASGFVLDLLGFHANERGYSISRTSTALHEAYMNAANLDRVVGSLENHYLLGRGVGPVGAAPTRLAHDTLAPLVTERLARSEKPVQEVRRILESRARGWQKGRLGLLLAQGDLENIRAAEGALRVFTEAERRLVAFSQAAEMVRDASRELEARRLGAALAHGLGALAKVSPEGFVEAELACMKSLQAAGGRALEGTAQPAFPPVVSSAPAVASISSGGSRLAVVEAGSGVRVWDMRRAKPRDIWLSADATAAISSVSLSDNGRFVIGIERDRVFLWDVDAPGAAPLRRTANTGGNASVAVSPDGRYLSVTGWKRRLLWDLLKPEGEGPIDDWKFDEADENIGGASFSPDGKWYVAAASHGSAAFYVSVGPAGGKATFQEKIGEQSGCWDFSPDGKWLVLAGSELRLLNLENGEKKTLVSSTNIRGGTIVRVAFDPQGQIIYYWTRFNEVWRFDLQRDDAPSPHLQGFVATAYRDGMFWTLDTYGHVWRKDSETTIRSTPGTIPDASPKDCLFVVSRDVAWVVDKKDGRCMCNDDRPPETTTALVHALERELKWADVDASGRLVVLGANNRLRVITPSSPPELPRLHATGFSSITGLAISPEGGRVVAVQNDRALLLDRFEPEVEPVPLELGQVVTAVVFSQDGSLLALGGERGMIEVYDGRTGKKRFRLAELGAEPVNALSLFAGARERWLVAGSPRETPRIWDLSAPQEPPAWLDSGELRTLARAMCFTDDGTWLVTGCDDRPALLWRTGVPPQLALIPAYDLVGSSFDWSTRTLNLVDQAARLHRVRFTSGKPEVVGVAELRERLIGIPDSGIHAFDAGGRWLAVYVGSLDIVIFDLHEENPCSSSRRLSLPVLESGFHPGHWGAIRHLDIDREGRWLLTIGSNDQVWLHVVDSLMPESRTLDLGPVAPASRAAYFLADGEWVIVGSADGTLRSWPLRMEELRRIGEEVAGR